MPLSAASHPPDLLRSRLMASLYKDHRPELADLVADAALLPELDGLWVEPPAAFRSLNAAWLEGHLLRAACEAGLRLEWVHVLGTHPGTEMF